MTTTAVPSKLPEDFALNIDNLDKFSNSTSPTFTDRLGVVKKTITGVLAEYPNASGNAADAAVSAGDAQTQANIAMAQAGISTAQAGLAATAKTAAEAARDASFVTGPKYAAEALGRAAVADGVTFLVQGSGDVAALEYRRVSAGTVSTLIANYPSAAAVDGLKAVLNITAPASPVQVAGIADPLALFSAPGPDGLLYNLMAFLPDGSIDSAPMDKFVVAKLGGQSFEQITATDWGAFVYTQMGADGFLYALSGMLADNSFYAPGLAAAGSAGELLHIPLMGQSNAAADQAQPVITSTATGWGGYRFARGVATWSVSDNAATPVSRATAGFSLAPLTASGVETRANGMADAYKARLANTSRYSAKVQTGSPNVLVSFSGIGSRRLTELGPVNDGGTDPANTRAAPGGHWATMLDDMVRGKAAAAAANLSYSVPFWVYDQGEREGDGKLYEMGSVLAASAVRSGYATLAMSMVNAFDAAARGVTGQTRPIPLLVTPPCANPNTSSAWQDVADQTDLCIMVGPRYQMPSAYNATTGTGAGQVWGDSIHYTADGQRWIGEMCAKVAHRVLNEGERWQPLRALSAVKVDTSMVDVTMAVPRPPMVIDTTMLAKALGWGFLIYNGTIDAPANKGRATAIELRPDGRTLRLTFAAVPAGAKLGIGTESIVDFGSAPAVASVGTGPASAAGFATYTLTLTGDYLAQLAPLTREGVFFCYGSGPSRGHIRGVALVGGNTVLTGETRELRTDGANVPFAAGNTLTFGRATGFTNLRDSDPALALNTFVNDPRAGQLYPLHNWLSQYDGLTIQGA